MPTRRRPVPSCPPEAVSPCPVTGELSLLATGMQAMFDEQRKQTEMIGDIRVLGEQRAADVRELKGDFSGHIATQGERARAQKERDEALQKRVDDHASQISAMAATIKEREGLFRHVRRLVVTVAAGIGMVVMSAVAYGGAWVVKKLTGVDITPFLKG